MFWQEINFVVFLDPLPVFAVADSMGFISLFSTPPSIYGYHKLITCEAAFESVGL
jgi:hypothetical protein